MGAKQPTKFKVESFFKYLRGRERHDSQSLIKLIKQAFIECEEAHPSIESDIKQLFFRILPPHPSIENVKSAMHQFFETPDVYDVGQQCSDIFMKAAQSLSHDDL